VSYIKVKFYLEEKAREGAREMLKTGESVYVLHEGGIYVSTDVDLLLALTFFEEGGTYFFVGQAKDSNHPEIIKAHERAKQKKSS